MIPSSFHGPSVCCDGWHLPVSAGPERTPYVCVSDIIRPATVLLVVHYESVSDKAGAPSS